MIVGLLGMSKMGKDEFATPFLEAGYKRYAFGDKVKKNYAELNNLPVEEMFNECKEKHRDGIINYGETLRKDNPFHWVDEIKNEIISDHNNGINIIITDVRRIPEILFIKALKNTYGDVFLYEIERSKDNGGVFDDDMESTHAIMYANYNNLVTEKIMNISTKNVLNNLGMDKINEINKIKRHGSK